MSPENNMSPTLLVLILVVALACIVQCAPKAQEKNSSHPNCQEFTKGLTFDDDDALGTWHLLHYKTETMNGSGDSHCVEFISMNDQYKTGLKERIGKYVEDLNWDMLTLKMQIPCSSLHPNKTRDYYLEKLEGDGSYKTLQMPSPTAKPELADYHRYPMRLKMVEGTYLGMMDCHEKFVFLLGKQPPEGKPLDEHLKKLIDSYWPEEFN